MDSPLKIDQENVKRFKLDAKHDPSPQQKISFLQNQLSEIHSQYWRERVNLVHAKRLQESDLPALKIKGNNNIIEHENSVQQLYGAIVQIKQFIEELRAAYPELKPKE